MPRNDGVKLAALKAAVLALYPEATAMHLTTSDQNLRYGFEITDVTRDNMPPLTPEELDTLSDRIDVDLLDLDWDGEVGEDKHGNAWVRLTEEGPW